MEENLTEEEMDMPEEEVESLCLQRAEVEFRSTCVGPLEHMDSTLPFAKISGLTTHILFFFRLV
jgi:hypothetical protein